MSSVIPTMCQVGAQITKTLGAVIERPLLHSKFKRQAVELRSRLQSQGSKSVKPWLGYKKVGTK